MNNPTAWTKPLEVVFLTSFSDTCFRTIPAVAQMIDDIAVNLTIVHAYDSKQRRHVEAEHALYSFFPEADRYSNTVRRTMPGTPVDVLRRVRDSQAVDLVMCPASDLLGLPRPGHRSLRSRILREIGLPVWSIGRGIEPARLGKQIHNVGCWVNFDQGPVPHVAFAAEYAAKLKARLHLFYVTPEIHEGMILPVVPDRPLHPEGIRNFFQNRLGHLSVQPEIHMTSHHGGSMGKLTRNQEIDVLFNSVTTWPFLSGFHNVDRCPCPTICFSRKFTPEVWNLKPGSAFTHRLAESTPVRSLQPR